MEPEGIAAPAREVQEEPDQDERTAGHDRGDRERVRARTALDGRNEELRGDQRRDDEGEEEERETRDCERDERVEHRHDADQDDRPRPLVERIEERILRKRPEQGRDAVSDRGHDRDRKREAQPAGHPPCIPDQDPAHDRVREVERQRDEQLPQVALRLGNLVDQRDRGERDRKGAEEPEHIRRVHAGPLALCGNSSQIGEGACRLHRYQSAFPLGRSLCFA